MIVKNEFLIIFADTGSFCTSIEAFNKYLTVDSSIKISSGKIKYVGSIECDYRIADGEIENNRQKYFHVEISLNASENSEKDAIIKLSELLKKLRELIYRIGGRIEVLWDDISKHYASLAYPKIFETECLMRKLILNFMLVTVGKDWATDALPKDIQEKVGKSKRKENENLLHSLDFIDLTPILIKSYSTVSNDDYYKLVRNASTIEDLENLKSLAPQSNWKRYFAPLISDCEDSQLSKMWESLYELRCKVAHNSSVSKFDYDTIEDLTSKLKTILSNAIGKLPQVIISKEEREIVAENTATSLNALYGQYIHTWKKLESKMYALGGGDQRYSISRIIENLNKNGAIDEIEAHNIKVFSQIRNHIVHSNDYSIDENTLKMLLEELGNYQRVLDKKAPQQSDDATPKNDESQNLPT